MRNNFVSRPEKNIITVEICALTFFLSDYFWRLVDASDCYLLFNSFINKSKPIPAIIITLSSARLNPAENKKSSISSIRFLHLKVNNIRYKIQYELPKKEVGCQS